MFSKSELQVLQDVGAKAHNVDDDARSVIANFIVKNHKVNLLQESSKQVHHVSKELTAMIRNGMALSSYGRLMYTAYYCHECLISTSLAPASLSTSGNTSDPPGKSLPPDALFPSHMNSSSTVEASLSSSSSKGRKRSGDSLVQGIKWRRLEKGPVTFRSFVDIAHAMV